MLLSNITQLCKEKGISIAKLERETGKYARELSEKDHYSFRFSVYITDGHKEGDKEFEKDLRYFIRSKYAYRQN